MKTWTVYDFFQRISGSTHWPSSDPNDSPVDTFKCKKCGYTFSMMMYGSYQAGDTPPQEHAEQKMLAHIAMFHRDGLGREPLAFAEGNPDIQPTFNFQVRDSLVGEGIRIQKCPWCADGFHESLAAEILAQYGIKIREKAEDTMARRKKEGWG